VGEGGRGLGDLEINRRATGYNFTVFHGHVI